MAEGVGEVGDLPGDDVDAVLEADVGEFRGGVDGDDDDGEEDDGERRKSGHEIAHPGKGCSNRRGKEPPKPGVPFPSC